MKALFIIAMLLALAIGAFLLGPRVKTDTRYEIPRLPDDLDGWLHTSESTFNDLVENTEKKIVWANAESKQQTDLSFVYLHGFSASRQETAPVTDRVAENFNANVFYTRLRGHGRSDDAMAEGSVNGWINDTVEAMAIGRKIGKKVILVGSSTGGTLAWWLSQQKEFSNDIAALVLLSPNFQLKDKNASLTLLPWGNKITHAIIGRYRSFEPESEAQAKYWTYRYPSDALLPMVATVKLASRLSPENQTHPVFMAYSNLDDIVDVAVINDYYERLQVEKERLTIDDNPESARHVIVGDIMAPDNNQLVIDAISDFLSSKASLR